MKNKSDLLHYAGITLRGMAMGTADVIPGMSGGTIAFITGIYERLLNTIKSFDGAAVKLLFRGRFHEFAQKTNVVFLLSLFLGIAIAVFSLAGAMRWLLEAYHVPTMAFFFGLIFASAFIVSRQVHRWSAAPIAGLFIGIAGGFAIGSLPAPELNAETISWWFIMFSGAVAVCAMILPGISGSFILLLLGTYSIMMKAVSDVDIPRIALFVVGAACGLILFSRLLSWLLKHYNDILIAVLMGAMVGSLNKIWPWKQTIAAHVDAYGPAHHHLERNLWPNAYETATGAPAHMLEAALMCVLGFVLIFGVEYMARKIAAKKKDAAAVPFKEM